MIKIDVRKATKKDAEQINQLCLAMPSLLSNVTYSADKQLFIVAEHEHSIIGVSRLCHDQRHIMLRTMRVLPEFQSYGVGKKILLSIHGILNGLECYCVPYPHLIKFYESIGFAKIEEKYSPKAIQKAYKKYHHLGMDMALMRKAA